jgi:hypothetical protein
MKISWPWWGLCLFSSGLMGWMIYDVIHQKRSAVGYGAYETYRQSLLDDEWQSNSLTNSTLKSLDWQAQKLHEFIKQKNYLKLSQYIGAFEDSYYHWKQTEASRLEKTAFKQGAFTLGGLSAYDIEVGLARFSQRCHELSRASDRDMFEYYFSIRPKTAIELLDTEEQILLNGKLKWVPTLNKNQYYELVDDWFSEYALSSYDTYSNELLIGLLNHYHERNNRFILKDIKAELYRRLNSVEWNTYYLRTEMMRYYLATDKTEQARKFYRADYSSKDFYRYFSRQKGQLLVHFEPSYKFTVHAQKMMAALKEDVPGVDRDGIDGMVEELIRLNRLEDALRLINYIKYDYPNTETLFLALLERMLLDDFPRLNEAFKSFEWFCRNNGCKNELKNTLLFARFDLKKGRKIAFEEGIAKARRLLIQMFEAEWDKAQSVSQMHNPELFQYFELLDKTQPLERILNEQQRMGNNVSVWAYLAGIHRFDTDSTKYTRYLNIYINKSTWGLPEAAYLNTLLSVVTADAMKYYGMREELADYMCYQQGTRI